MMNKIPKELEHFAGQKDTLSQIGQIS